MDGSNQPNPLAGDFLSVLKQRRLISDIPSNPGSRSEFVETTATTILSFKYAGGVLVAGDRRATAGDVVMYDRADKVLEIDRLIDEPYRWVEAISNRREYIENELAAGSPTIGLSFSDGILLLTFGRDSRKIFEIYDRIAICCIGHPGDIERLRMMAIELASTEGFTSSSADVSLRRMVTYSFSPALKQAFEQIYGPPYLARILFAEIGGSQEEDLFVRLDYDGSMHPNSMSAGKRREIFGAIAGTRRGLEQVEGFLRRAKISNLRSALETAVRAWGVALYTSEEDHPDAPEEPALKEFVKSRLEHYSVEAALLERGAAESHAAFVEVPECDLENVLSGFR